MARKDPYVRKKYYFLKFWQVGSNLKFHELTLHVKVFQMFQWVYGHLGDKTFGRHFGLLRVHSATHSHSQQPPEWARVGRF